MPPPPPRLGTYEILAEIKSGGMATLYLGRRSGPAGFSRHVAIKVLKDHLATQGELVKMFIDEARIASRIDHPNVVRIEELGEENERFFLVMEYVHGAALSELLTKLSGIGRRLTPTVAAALTMAMAEGLHAAHETRDDAGQLLNVVHRDVSPQNVLVGVGGEVKVIDFGIAKARDRLHTTEAGSGLKGKLRYMAPEQLQRSPVDRRADVYALGVVLWEMLAMRRLFQGASDPEVVQRVLEGRLPSPGAYVDVPFGLDGVVLRALSRDPSDRPPTARAFRELIRETVPEAARVEPSDLTALLFALLGDELAERAKDVPSLEAALGPHGAPSRALERFTERLEDVVHESETLVTHDGPLILSPAGVAAYLPANAADGGFDALTAPPTIPETAPPAHVVPPPRLPRPSAGSPFDLKSIALLVGGLILGAVIAAGLLLATRADPPPQLEIHAVDDDAGG